MGGTARTRSVSTRTVSTELMGRYGNTMKRESEPESEMRLQRSIRLQTYSSATSHVAGVNVAVGVVGRFIQQCSQLSSRPTAPLSHAILIE